MIFCFSHFLSCFCSTPHPFSFSYDKLKKSVSIRLSGESAEDVAAAQEAATVARLMLPESELYPLLARPDAELTPEELKEKSKQKRAKAIGEIQLQRRREKEQRLALEKQQREIEEQEFEANPEEFIKNLQRQKEAILLSREDRLRAENDATGRRSAASKKRMQLLATMGGSGGSIEAIEKQLARKDKASFAKESTFGMKDEDWKIYEEVRLPSAAAGVGGRFGERDESDEEREQLQKIQSKLNRYDPHGSVAVGSSPPVSSLTRDDFVVPLWVDRVRLPEMFFQPHALLGIDEAGIAELMTRIFDNVTSDQADRLARHILLVGGSTQFPHFRQRIANEVRQIRPFALADQVNVAYARHPQWDAWRGAARITAK